MMYSFSSSSWTCAAERSAPCAATAQPDGRHHGSDAAQRSDDVHHQQQRGMEAGCRGYGSSPPSAGRGIDPAIAAQTKQRGTEVTTKRRRGNGGRRISSRLSTSRPGHRFPEEGDFAMARPRRRQQLVAEELLVDAVGANQPPKTQSSSRPLPYRPIIAVVSP